ncbi:glycosyltransferase family A protein [Autumnicola psychrophila]|uniref:Glycosyltransferase family A protein n=1 Tax=Autumnicola psychrophila TaxID=3075592 RepID=A0ABU3DT96_9FLAO|nr:glycosyltransferase family A protein [Zunongwangia sp. F225]MDT0686863.1 glycosyltransferase family A protein [Zunongwangia sp. F225]
MKNTLVSIIVPNYNHSQFLKLRLRSVFNQTYQNFEVILLDDSSSDGSMDILLDYRSHPKVSHCIFNEDNSGSTFKQWSKGIGLAKGEFVWIAESDDYCEVTFLEKLLKLHSADSGIALSFCQSHRMNADGKVTGNWITHTSKYEENIFRGNFKMNGSEFIEKYLIHKNVIPNVSAVLFKKEELIKITPLVFNPFMKYNADWVYYVQLLCNSKVAFLAETLNFFRYHESSVIAKAGGESGWLRIFKMELETRAEMLGFIKKCNPGNYKRIKDQAKIGNNRLYWLIAKSFINRGSYLRGLGVVWNKPRTLKKIVKHTVLRIMRDD